MRPLLRTKAGRLEHGHCPQRRFLDTHGEGVFHIGFEAELDTATSQAKASGLDALMSGRRENGTGFVY